jgi:hypothetical protein
LIGALEEHHAVVERLLGDREDGGDECAAPGGTARESRRQSDEYARVVMSGSEVVCRDAGEVGLSHD